VLQKPGQAQGPEGLGVILILTGILAPRSAASSFSTGQGLFSHSSTKKKKELLPPALVFKIPGTLMALGFMPSLEFSTTTTLGVPRRSKERSFWVEPTMHIYSGSAGGTQRMRRSEEEGKVRNASQVCGFGNLEMAPFPSKNKGSGGKQTRVQ